MPLTREQVVGAALAILRDFGLADLSMRRLARDLGVQPGALYWHVKNKQELLGVLAGRILAGVPLPAGGVGPGASDGLGAVRRVAADIRTALLSVRDGADVVSLAQALTPESLAPLTALRSLLADSGLGERQARWGARTLTHYILGAVAEEQTHAELAAAGLLAGDREAGGRGAGSGEPGGDEAFRFGVDIVLAGLAGLSASPA
ncbi:TetR/AcrR family transcriptional regulator C-terminal domain-containing protein [Specibacter cremeus]|uniref:TetR/AcrR family transcriptional regulator C-terminal domain-containing protein n=1 Tax=Specibacter cremeus TaxID=1629051 RepID=UPI000F76C29F|nr:TetR/AcrR family transcriptional regulator C-terminal domain-containing protein [Specibacter cremeus]